MMGVQAMGIVQYWWAGAYGVVLGVCIALVSWLIAGAIVKAIKRRKKLVPDDMFESETERYRGLAGEPPRNPRRYEVRQ